MPSESSLAFQVGNILVGILVFVAIVSLVKGILAKDGESKVTNFIEVGLITFVITYVPFVATTSSAQHTLEPLRRCVVDVEPKCR